MAIPAFASEPTNENAPAMTSDDQQFMGLTTLSEEELMEISGNLNHHGCGGESVDGYINVTPTPTVKSANKESDEITLEGSYTGEGTGGYHNDPSIIPSVVL